MKFFSINILENRVFGGAVFLSVILVRVSTNKLGLGRSI